MALNPGQWWVPLPSIGPLGHGGMATVYKGLPSRLDRNGDDQGIHKAFTEDAGFIAAV